MEVHLEQTSSSENDLGQASAAFDTIDSSSETSSPQGWGIMRSTVSRLRNVSPSNAAALLRRKTLEKAIGGSSDDNRYWELEGYVRPDRMTMLAATDAKGNVFDMAALTGKVTIIVNVATL